MANATEKPLVKNVYFNKDKDSELIEWINNSTNFSSMVRLMLYEKFNNEKKVNVIQQQPYTNGNQDSEFRKSFANKFKKY